MNVEWNAKTIEKSLKDISVYEVKIREIFVKLLNDYSNMNEDFPYWDFVAGEWLFHFIHNIYAHYISINESEIQPSSEVTVPTFWDYKDYADKISECDVVDIQVHKSIEHFILNGEQSSWKFTSVDYTSSHWVSFKMAISRLCWRWITKVISGNNSTFLICDPYIMGPKYKWLMVLYKWRRWAKQDDFTYFIEKTFVLDEAWRIHQASKFKGSSFLNVIATLMPLYIPNIYLEGFTPYLNKASKLNIKRPKAIYTANGLQGNTLLKFLAAKWRSEGTLILAHQHGGGYGIDKVSVIEDYETRIADCFYTFGWIGKKRQTPLSGSNIRLNFQNKPISKKVLLCTVNYPKSVYRIHFQPMPGMVEGMIEETCELAAKIHDHCVLIVRPYSKDYNRDFIYRLRRTGAKFAVENPGKYGPKSFASAEIVVHTYLGTSWLETLAMNIPTVCLYNPDIYWFRDDAMEFIKKLINVGILHSSVESASNHLINIMNNAEEWWGDLEVQEARQSFVREYANFDNDWEELWEKEFKKYI